MNGTRLTHAQMLPAIRAENEAWQEEYLPAIRARQERQLAERERAIDLVNRGLSAIEASGDDRALVARLTGFVL